MPNTNSEMRILCVLFMVGSFIGSAYGQNNARLPPSIKTGPQGKVIFREQQPIALPCEAEGTPPLRYEWRLNGVVLHLNLPKFRVTEGELKIINATGVDDGFYQCFATNQYGTALSSVAHIQHAFLQDASQSFVNVTAQEGHPFVIQAARRDSFPVPTYSWETATGTIDKDPQKFVTSQRVHSACNGDLHFAYAEKADELNGNIYKSIVFNAVTDQRLGGSYARVIVTQGSGSPPHMPPNLTYVSMSQDVALIDGKIELKCFFSGNPLPEITWSGPGSNLPVGRTSFPSSEYKAMLILSNIIESDEGAYVCTGTNSMGTKSETFDIRVQAVPNFKQESDRPRNVNVTERDSITFNCSAFAKPDATVVWLRNGQPIDVTTAPKRFAFSSDMKTLTIRDVCRDCRDHERQTDLMVIQCNASNVHGHAFASGYLNVLLRTKVTLQPNLDFVSVDLTTENRFQFDCTATSDPSTPLTVRWFKVDERGTELVYNDLPYIQVMDGSLTISTEPNCSSACEKHFGEYRCIGNNGYTQDSVTLILNGTTDPIEKPRLPPGPLIWIIIGIAIGLFLLFLILICCIVCYLNKGDEYDVDDKERKSGKIPEEEILSEDFQDYYPSEDIKRKGSGASMGSTVMFKSMDNINEFDEDMNFGEDGSFVGKYA